MKDAAYNDGITIVLVSAFRSVKRQRELAKKQNATEFVKRIKETCKLGARNYRTAIRWILEADELEHDFQHEGGYLVWEYNLAYRHKKLFKTAGVA